MNKKKNDKKENKGKKSRTRKKPRRSGASSFSGSGD
jgi:hypothetical protein